MYSSLWSLLLTEGKKACLRDLRVRKLSPASYSLTSCSTQDSEPASCLGSTLELTVFCFVLSFFAFLFVLFWCEGVQVRQP